MGVPMKGLSSTGSTRARSISTCSFCKSPDHQVSKCPHVPIIKKSLDKGIIPLKYMATVTPNNTSGQSSSWRQQSSFWRSPLSSWFSNGENWGELYKQTYKAFAKWERAQERAKNKGKRTKATKRTCGYCGGDHTRRTCGLLASHKTKLAKANRNFRKWFYQEYVEGQGLSTGAIVDIEVHDNGGYNRQAKTETIRTLVTEINWESINLFALKQQVDTSWRKVQNWTGRELGCGQEKLDNIQSFIHSGAYLKVPKSAFESKGIECGSSSGYRRQEESPYRAVPLPLVADLQQQSPYSVSNSTICSWGTKSRYYNAGKINSVAVVSRAPQVLADDWIDGYSEEMSVIFKKFSLAQLEFLGVIDHIKEWAKKDQ